VYCCLPSSNGGVPVQRRSLQHQLHRRLWGEALDDSNHRALTVSLYSLAAARQHHAAGHDPCLRCSALRHLDDGITIVRRLQDDAEPGLRPMDLHPIRSCGATRTRWLCPTCCATRCSTAFHHSTAAPASAPSLGTPDGVCV
jgi:hypothetical protein